MGYLCGIDLGTTYSSIAWYDQDNHRVDTIDLESADGSKTLRSVVYYPGAGQPPVVGSTAWNACRKFPDQVAAYIKAHMGTGFIMPINGQEYTPQEISAEILKTLVRDAQTYLGDEVNDVVITVPAYFGEKERAATLEAGRLAGLNVLGLLPEPHAAALAFAIEKVASIVDRYLLVYDLGGGTFDVTLIHATAQTNPDGKTDLNIDTLCKAGNAALGGLDWDRALAGIVTEKILAAHGIDISEDPRNEPVLLDNCEKAKRDLSRMSQVAIIGDLAGRQVNVSLAEFEDRTRPLLDSTIFYMEQVIEDAGQNHGISRDQIEVMLCGGSSKMPMVHKMIEGLTGKPPLQHRNPELLGSIGAAYRAYLLQPEDSTDAIANSSSVRPGGQAPLKLTAQAVIEMFAEYGLPVCDDADQIKQRIDARRPSLLKQLSSPQPMDQKRAEIMFRNADAMLNHRADLLEIVYSHFTVLADNAITAILANGATTFTIQIKERIRQNQGVEACHVSPELSEHFMTRYLKEHEYLEEGNYISPSQITNFQATSPFEQSSPSRTPDVPGTIDRVHFSVASPPLVSPGCSFLIDIWAHLEQQRLEMLQRAKQAVHGKEIFVKSKGPVAVARGTVLTVNLKIDNLLIYNPEDTILWEGEIGSASFAIQVPQDAALGSRLGQAAIYAGTVQVARIDFELTVGEKLSEARPIPSVEKHYRSAFASYASADRDEVLRCIQGMEKAAPSLDIFMDVHSLRSGQKWEQEMWSRIPASDVFYLFWSANAKKSPWVEKEWRCALSAHGLDFIDPVPLVPPDIAPPPPELASLHFNDWQLAYHRLSRR